MTIDTIRQGQRSPFCVYPPRAVPGTDSTGSTQTGLWKRALENPSFFLGSLLPKAYTWSISLRSALPKMFPSFWVFWALFSFFCPPAKFNVSVPWPVPSHLCFLLLGNLWRHCRANCENSEFLAGWWVNFECKQHWQQLILIANYMSRVVLSILWTLTQLILTLSWSR